MKTKAFFFITVLFLMSLFANAQKGVEDGSKYGSGEDSIRCIRNLSLYREYARQNLYENAMPFWRVVFNECPEASKNIYIDGVKIYKYKIQNTEDEELKKKYIDTLLMVYDQRIKYFNEEGNVLARKGVALLNYNGSNIEAIEQAYECFNRSIELEGVKTMAPVLAAYMNACVALNKNDKISQEELINKYITITDIIDKKLKKNSSNPHVKQIQGMVDECFSESDAVSCEELVNLFCPKYEEAPENIDLLKKINTMLKSNDCKSSELYFKVSAGIHETAPSAQSAYDMAMLAKDHNKLEKTVDYLKEAIEMETDNEEKASYYVQLGDIMFNEYDDMVQARKYAREAIEITDSYGRPYMLIGNLYASSVCNSNGLEKKAIYWIAVDYYQKAKSIDPSTKANAERNIKLYSQYFPDKETIFFHGLKPGEKYKVGCWINEATTVRTKD